MATILITAGPTREFLDPVRYLSNASSGRMACALATALVQWQHQVIIVSGPVEVSYPSQATIIPVVSTDDMLQACLQHVGQCDGVIAVAAPCDYRPQSIARHKIKKIEGQSLTLELQPTPDILAAMTEQNPQAWYVGFALETENGLAHAIEKKHRKRCDWILLNQAAAIGAAATSIQIIDHNDQAHAAIAGDKTEVACEIARRIHQHFVMNPS